MLSYLCYQKNNIQHLMLANTDNKMILIQVLPVMIYHNSVRMLVLYYMFMYYGIFIMYS